MNCMNDVKTLHLSDCVLISYNGLNELIENNKFSKNFDYARLLSDLPTRINSKTLEILADKNFGASNKS